MQSDSTHPFSSERQPLRCLLCERFLATAVGFAGRVDLRCSRCKCTTTFERPLSEDGEIDRFPKKFAVLSSAPSHCAECGRALLSAPIFSGAVELKCHSCKWVNRVRGDRHAVAIEKLSLVAHKKPRPPTDVRQWEPDELIRLLEGRWETFVREKRRAQAELAVGLRFDVFMRDDFKCRYCGRSVDDGLILHVDHVIPKSKGGPDALDNLVTACLECNLGKSNKDLPVAPETAMI